MNEPWDERVEAIRYAIEDARLHGWKISEIRRVFDAYIEEIVEREDKEAEEQRKVEL
jgi:hypothetical protein